MDFRTLTIGRSAASDIQIRDQTVSRLHAELTVTGAGRCYLTDCGSLRGTSVYRRGVWTPHRQGYVDLNERVRFGTFETQLDPLLRGTLGGAASNREREGTHSSRPKRNIETGQVEAGRVNAE
ncbi:MAG: FHA domain-containing protein [Bryobacterales bacterium]|nr:FHA domain-containing protein [Bryobacterales bacterium]